MPEWVISGGAVLAVWAVPNLVVYFLSRINTDKIGFTHGKITSAFLTKKGGKAYTKSEGRLQQTVNDYVKAWNRGMDSDDEH